MYNYQQSNYIRQNQVQQLSLIDPYVVSTLKTIIGSRLIVDTTRGTVQGYLKDVKPDHIVLKDREDDLPVFIRIQQIVYIMPLED